MLVSCNYNRMPFATAGRHELHIQPRKREMVGQPLAATAHFQLVIGFGTDARNGQKFLEDGDGLLVSGIDGLQDG